MPTYEIAEWYEQAVETGSLIHGLVLPAVLELAGRLEGLRILDLACGEGIAARALAEKGARVVGVDLSLELLRRARRRGGINYVLADARRWPRWRAKVSRASSATWP